MGPLCILHVGCAETANKAAGALALLVNCASGTYVISAQAEIHKELHVRFTIWIPARAGMT